MGAWSCGETHFMARRSWEAREAMARSLRCIPMARDLLCCTSLQRLTKQQTAMELHPGRAWSCPARRYTDPLGGGRLRRWDIVRHWNGWHGLSSVAYVYRGHFSRVQRGRNRAVGGIDRFQRHIVWNYPIWGRRWTGRCVLAEERWLGIYHASQL